MLSLQDGTTTTPRRCLLGLFHRMYEVAPCRRRTLDRRHIPWIRLSSELFQSKPYRMTMLIQTMQLFVHCELSAFKTFLLNWKFFLDLISPEFCQLGEVKWNSINLMTSTDQLPSWRLNEFLTETLQVKNGSEHFSGHPKPHLMPRQAFKHLQRPPTLVRGGKGRKEGRPLNVAIEMWTGQNACSDRSPGAQHTANTTEISTLPSGRFIGDHAIEFSKPRVRMHYSTLHGWNSWQWCGTSHIHNCNQWNSPNAHTPCCHLPSVMLRVCSIG